MSRSSPGNAPVQKEPGAKLLSGSFAVAGSGSFLTAVGSDAYAQRIAGESKRYVRLHSDLTAGINGFLRVIAVGSAVAGLTICGTLIEGVTNTVAALVAMIPQGLVLMASIAFAVAAVKLARKKVHRANCPRWRGWRGLMCSASTRPAPSPSRSRHSSGWRCSMTAPASRPPQSTAAGPAARRRRRPAASSHERWRSAGTRGHRGYRFARQLHSERYRGSHPSAARVDGGRLGPVLLGPQVERGPPCRARLLGAGGAGDRSGGRRRGGPCRRRDYRHGPPRPFGDLSDSTNPIGAERSSERDGGSAAGGRMAVGGRPAAQPSRASPPRPQPPPRLASRRPPTPRKACASASLRTDSPLNGERLPEGLKPFCLVILSERVRRDAPETLAYFRKQGVQIKVISGDNPATVATIAAKAGVEGADRAVDARDLPEGGEELAEIMDTHHRFRQSDPRRQGAAMVKHTAAARPRGGYDRRRRQRRAGSARRPTWVSPWARERPRPRPYPSWS